MSQDDKAKSKEMRASKTVRASTSFPRDVYLAMKALAKEKKVSLGWVVREASEKYIAEQKHLVQKQG